MIQTPLFTMNIGRVLSTFTPRITMHSKLCAFLRRLIGLSSPPHPPEISATMRGELIDLVDNEASRNLIERARTQSKTNTLAPKPVQKPEPRPAAAPPIKPIRKPRVRRTGGAHYVMQRKHGGTREKGQG